MYTSILEKVSISCFGFGSFVGCRDLTPQNVTGLCDSFDDVVLHWADRHAGKNDERRWCFDRCMMNVRRDMHVFTYTSDTQTPSFMNKLLDSDFLVS